MLAPAPAGFVAATPIDLAKLDSMAVGRDTTDGRVLFVRDAKGALYLQISSDTSEPLAALVPFDPAFELRFEAALRLFRRLMGQRVALLPAALQLTQQQTTRLIQLLHAFDIHEAGGRARDVAANVLNADEASLPSVEWKDSAARRRALRLIKDSAELVKRGYLKILRGKFR